MKVIALVTKFKQSRVCAVTPVGEAQQEYHSNQVYWVERPEDMYGVHSAPNPGCILDAMDWRRGIPDPTERGGQSDAVDPSEV